MRQVSVTSGVLLAIALSAVSLGQTTSQSKASGPTKQIQMSGGMARLDKPVNTGKASAGDAVTATLMEAIQLSDGTTLPKDAILGGHVVAVERSQNGSDSELVLQFNQVTANGKVPIPVKVTMLSLKMPPVPGPDKTDQERLTPSFTSGIAPGIDSGMPSIGDLVAAKDYNTKDPSLPGTTLTSGIKDANSGTMTSKGKNTQLPLWTQIQIAIVHLPANAVIK